MRKASRPFDQVAIQEVRQYCQGQIEAFLGLRHQARTCCRRATGTGSEADATFVDHNPARHVRGGDYLDNRATHLPQLQNNGWPISLSKLKAHPDVIDDQCRASIPYGLWDRPPSGFAKEPVVHFTLIHFHEPSLRSRERRDGVERAPSALGPEDSLNQVPASSKARQGESFDNDFGVNETPILGFREELRELP